MLHTKYSLFIRQQQMLVSIYVFKLVEMAYQTTHNYFVMFRFQNCLTFVPEWSPPNASVTVYTPFYVHTFVYSYLDG